MANGTDTPQTNAFEGQGEQLLGRPTPPPAASAPATPGMGVSPQPEQTTAAAPPAATLQPPAAPAQPQIDPRDLHRKTWLGHVAESIHDSVHGVETVYKVNPDTGEMETGRVEKGPGSFFKKLVAGMLIGGAVGSEKPEQGFMGGFARGGGAAVAVEEKREEAKRAHAGEDFERQQRSIKQKADIAHGHNADLLAVRNLDLAEKEHLDKVNTNNEAIKHIAETAGGVMPTISVGGEDINGVQGNGSALMQHHIDTKSLDKAPEGYHRVHTMKVDYTGLNQKLDKDGVRWVDAKGNYVDLADRTTHMFFDVPVNDWDTPRKYEGSFLNKALGVSVYTPDKEYNIAPSAVFGGNVQKRHMDNQALLAKAAGDKVDVLEQKIKDFREKASSAQEKGDVAAGHAILADLTREMTGIENELKDITLPAQRKQELQNNLKARQQEALEVRNQIKSWLGMSTAAATPVATPHTDMIQDFVSHGRAENMSPEKFEAEMNSSSQPPDVKTRAIEAYRQAAGAKKPTSEAPTAATAEQYRALQEAKRSMPTKRREDSRLDPDTKRMVKGTYYLVPGKGEQFVPKSEEAQFLKGYQDKVNAAQAAWDKVKK